MRRLFSNPLIAALAAAWLLLSLLFVLGLAGLARTTQLPHMVPLTSAQLSRAYDPQVTNPADIPHFQRELRPFLAAQSTTEAKVLTILQWVMNQFSVIGHQGTVGSWEQIQKGRDGSGVICSDLAQVFHDALISVGIPARRVLLQRNLFDPFDTHVTVEALVDGAWRVYDPTFHVALKSQGTRVGIYEAREWLMKGKGSKFDIEFLGPVRYPARHSSYYVRFDALLNNVYVELKRSQGVKRAIPFAGVWLGPQWGYLKDEAPLSLFSLEFYRTLYLGTLVALPAINLLILLLIGFLWRMGLKRRTLR